MTQLQTAAASAAADQAVIVRYATELTRERDGLIQRSAELETKWITAECRNVVLRQRIADLMVRPSSRAAHAHAISVIREAWQWHEAIPRTPEPNDRR